MKRIEDVGTGDIVHALRGYIRSSDKFLRTRGTGSGSSRPRSTFAGLNPKLGEFQLDVDAPADCKHRPRWLPDQQHTTRRQAELRA